VTGPQSNPGERRRRTRNVVSYRGAGRRDSFGNYLVPRVIDIAGFRQCGRCRFLAVISAKAGTQAAWVPAGAGMTGCNQRPPRNQRREALGIFLARRDAPSRSRQCLQPDKAREMADQRPSRTHEKRCRRRPVPISECWNGVSDHDRAPNAWLAACLSVACAGVRQHASPASPRA
jgi:hypothetical protein